MRLGFAHNPPASGISTCQHTSDVQFVTGIAHDVVAQAPAAAAIGDTASSAPAEKASKNSRNRNNRKKKRKAGGK